MVLLAKIGNMLFSSRRGWRPSISNRVLHVPRMDVETEPIHFTQDDHHSIQEITFSVTPVPMEHSSDLRAENKVLTVARLCIEPTLPEG